MIFFAWRGHGGTLAGNEVADIAGKYRLGPADSVNLFAEGVKVVVCDVFDEEGAAIANQLGSPCGDGFLGI